MIPDRDALRQVRLASKDLDHQFRHRVEHGMACSPFVSEALTRIVHEVYLPVIDSPGNLRPGQILFQCTASKVGSGVALSEAEQISVILTIDGGADDLRVRKKTDIAGLRKHRLCRVCIEAYNQGGLLTVEDLAYRLFNVGERTIVRDLAMLRKDGENPPLRSTVRDIGRTISHKTVLIKNWLKGDELSDLNRKYNHSYSSIESYINTFKRVVFLKHEEYTLERIAYIQKISLPLVQSYLALWDAFKENTLPHRVREILDISDVGHVEGKKTTRKGS